MTDSNESVRVPTLLEYTFGVRAEVVVLLAVIVFLGLASSMNDSTRDPASQAGSTDYRGSEPQSQELV